MKLLQIGYEFGKKSFDIDKIKNRYLTFLIPGLLVTNILCGPLINGNVNLCGSTFGRSIMLYYVSAICGISFVYLVSAKIKKSKILSYVGKNSLLLFLVHSIFLHITEFILSAVYKKSIYALKNVPLFDSIIATIIIYFSLILIAVSYNRIKNKYKKQKKLEDSYES